MEQFIFVFNKTCGKCENERALHDKQNKKHSSHWQVSSDESKCTGKKKTMNCKSNENFYILTTPRRSVVFAMRQVA